MVAVSQLMIGGGWRLGGGRIYIVFLACPLALPLAVSLSRAWKVLAIFRTLLTSRTVFLPISKMYLWEE